MWHALREHLPDATTSQPPGGQGYWLKFAKGTDTGALAKHCLDRGIFVTGGVPWYYDAPDRLNNLRLGFTAIQDQHIVAGIEGIAAASRDIA
jgi:DNA-binding transcriptional MocR family regulator